LPEEVVINVEPRLNNHFHSIANNRRKIFSRFLETDEKYLKMQDRHIIHIGDGFKQAETFLDENPEWGGVALYPGKKLPKPDKRHIMFDCVVVRREALDGIKLEFTKGCDCAAFCREIRKKWKYGYLNKLNLITSANIKIRI